MPLRAISEFQSLDGIRQSYLGLGYDEVRIETMKSLFYHFVAPTETARIAKLEWMDEFEELDLMQSHYFISVAKKTVSKHPLLLQMGFEWLK